MTLFGRHIYAMENQLDTSKKYYLHHGIFWQAQSGIKCSTKWILLQIMLFSVQGIYAVVTDKL